MITRTAPAEYMPEERGKGASHATSICSLSTFVATVSVRSVCVLSASLCASSPPPPSPPLPPLCPRCVQVMEARLEGLAARVMAGAEGLGMGPPLAVEVGWGDREASRGLQLQGWG